MALVRSFTDEDYSCSHSTMIVGDSFDHFVGQSRESVTYPWAGEEDTEGGTFVVAGSGWMHVVAPSDDYHRVHLELHDIAPPLELADWEDVAETPFHTGSGWIGLGLLMADDVEAQLELEPDRLYRARVAWRPDGDAGHEIRLQFWPHAPADLPRFLARGSSDWSRYWREEGDLLDFLGAELRAPVRWSGGVLAVTAAELAATLLLPADLVGRVLAYEVAEDRLLIDGDPMNPTSPLTLRLTGESAEEDEDAFDWDDSEWEESDDDDLDGDDLGGSTEPAAEEVQVLLAALASAHAQASHVAITELHAGNLRGRRISLPPMGPPPAGAWISGQGEVLAWRSGRWRTVGSVGRTHGVRRAAETAAGIVVWTGRLRLVLVRPTGQVHELFDREVDDFAVAPDGAVWVLLSHRGRRPWTRLVWLDLVAGTSETFAWPQEDVMLVVAGQHDGGLVVWDSFEHGGAPSLRWVPGRGVETMNGLVSAADPWSGTLCLRDVDSTTFRIVGPGVDLRVGEDPPALGPGARTWYRIRENVLDLHTPDGSSRSIALPGEIAAYDLHNRARAWEGPTTLLLGLRYGHDHELACAALRVHTADGSIERVDLGPKSEGYELALVHPLLGHPL